MQSSPLQLENYYLKKLEFSLVDDLAEKPVENEKYEPVDFSVRYASNPLQEDKRRWRCELTVFYKNKKGDKVPYNFNVKLIGFFIIAEQWPEDRLDDLAKVNCPTVLYSAIREILISVTGRNTFPTLVLPSVSFISEAMKKKPARRSSTGKPETASKTDNTEKTSPKKKGGTVKKSS